MTEDNVKNLIRLCGFDDEIILTRRKVVGGKKDDYQFVWRGHMVSCSLCFQHGSCSKDKQEEKIQCTLHDIWVAFNDGK